jgi:uncharacterized protein (UPF0276 family)
MLSPSSFARGSLSGCGIGLRAAHVREVMERTPACAWFEIHSENYFAPGGAQRAALQRIRADYAISAHGVGLSLGSAGPIDAAHLEKLAELLRWLEPGLVSEHLSWGAIDGTHLNDLLPLPYSEEALAHMVARVSVVQDRLRRPLLIENVSSYLELPGADMPEWEFLAELARSTGCGILLDVNNVYVSARNHGFDPITYIDALPVSAIGELHVAGHSEQTFDGRTIVVDTHNTRVAPAVWLLLDHAARRFGDVPVLVEWDSELPEFGVLEQEAALASAYMDRRCDRAA